MAAIGARSAGVLLVGLLAAAPAGAAEPWRLEDGLGDFLGLPERLSLSGDHRVRYELLDDPFRAGRDGRDDVIAIRTRLRAALRLTPWLELGAEIQDSRTELEDPNTPIDTTSVNTLELLEARLTLRGEGPWDGRTTLRAGRITMDVGSRRFVARNRYRNTANGFDGLDLRWLDDAGRELRAFWMLPVRRLPDEPGRLRHDRVEFDRESVDTQLWGLFGRTPLARGDALELFVFGLHERDDPSRPTRNRELYTPGFRLLRAPRAGHFDYQVESAIQLGESRLGTASRQELDHFAHFHHVELGYRFDAPWSPRLALQFDYASGDEDPTDSDNERYDTLFGARRFDFGPTGIYGAFARSNVSTPGLRLQLKPAPTLSAFLAVRGFWLAEERDAWTTAGVVDPSGDAGRHVGTQAELRVRWDVVPGNVRFELGYAHLFAGDFIDDAPNSSRQGDSDYLYTQLSLSF